VDDTVIVGQTVVLLSASAGLEEGTFLAGAGVRSLSLSRSLVSLSLSLSTGHVTPPLGAHARLV
jgi:hypothetical protein